MTPYAPPSADQLLAITVNAGIAEIAASDRFSAAEPDRLAPIVSGEEIGGQRDCLPADRADDKLCSGSVPADLLYDRVLVAAAGGPIRRGCP